MKTFSNREESVKGIQKATMLIVEQSGRGKAEAISN